MSGEKKYLVKCLKSIGISGTPYPEGAEVYVNEADAKTLVQRKRVIALNFHIEYKRESNMIIVNDGTTKNQAEKIESFREKEKEKAKKETKTETLVNKS